jgi:hypothetical protein
LKQKEVERYHWGQPISLNRREGDLLLVSEAAKKLKMSPQTLRVALQEGKFPFGEAIVTTTAENSKVGKPRYTYYINEERLERYLRGEGIT